MRNRSFLFVLIISVFLLSACSSANSETITLNEILAHSALVIYEGAEEYALDTEILVSERGDKKSISIQYYWMAETARWESVKAHYRDILSTFGWELIHEDANSLRWDSGRQAFEIRVVPSDEGEGDIVVLILVSRK